MHLLTLLPALLFAQSSFAYYCCFEVTSKVSSRKFASFFESGFTEPWFPEPDCELKVIKTGYTKCSQWRSTVKGLCRGLAPIATHGVVTADHCPPS
ncbi:hypothetical protein Vi05172_g4690 [Venturia inaequalis]|nr:hypothetical protein Vi05172_g4690 [Venturia inaequalis]